MRTHADRAARSDAKNVRDVRNPRLLARLITMRPARVNQRFLKLLRQLHSMEQMGC